MALTDNLISYWKLDEASGDALDAHGSNTGTDNNTVGSATGKINNARDFEAGSGEFFEIADNASLSTGDIDFSVQAWVNFESGGTFQVVLSKISGVTLAGEWQLLRLNGDNMAFRLWNSGSVVASIVSVVILSNATWYLIHAWHDSVNNLVGIAINAGSAETASTGGSAPVDTTNGFGIGSNTASSSFSMDGLIDEVGFWKRVLTSGDRTELYNDVAGLAYPFGAGGVNGPLIGGRLIGGTLNRGRLIRA